MRVNDLGRDRLIVDKGTFSPGVAIDHVFATRLRIAPGADRTTSCEVVAVHFTDGSSWGSGPS